MQEADPAIVYSGRLMVGSASFCRSKAEHVSAVIQCAHEHENAFPQLPTLRLEWKEEAGEYLRDVQQAVFEFIDAANGPVLILCSAGQSRSVSIALLYMTQRGNMSLKNAFAELFRQRGVIQPNGDLWNQLIEICGESPTLSQDECRALVMSRPSQDEGIVVSSIAEWMLTIDSLEPKRGHHITILNSIIEEEFAQLLCKPPRNVTLIHLKHCSIPDESARRRINARSHIIIAK